MSNSIEVTDETLIEVKALNLIFNDLNNGTSLINKNKIIVGFRDKTINNQELNSFISNIKIYLNQTQKNCHFTDVIIENDEKASLWYLAGIGFTGETFPNNSLEGITKIITPLLQSGLKDFNNVEGLIINLVTLSPQEYFEHSDFLTSDLKDKKLQEQK